MSKTSKIRRLMTLCLSMLLVIAGAVFTAPTVNAAEVSATVIAAPGVAYVNVRNGAGIEYAKIGRIDAGEVVTLQCYKYTSGAEVKGPYSSSKIWYRIKERDNGWVSAAYVDAGVADPATPPCMDLQEPSPTCHGDTCNGLNPLETNCRDDAVTIFSTDARGREDGPILGEFRLQYSKKCNANWAEFNRPRDPSTMVGDLLAEGSVQAELYVWRQEVPNSLQGNAHAATFYFGLDDTDFSKMITADGTTCSSAEFYHLKTTPPAPGHYQEGRYNAPCLS